MLDNLGKMSAKYTIYTAINTLVRLAKRFLRMGDEERTERARDGLRSITENVGIPEKEKQFPIEELHRGNLVTRIPQMNGSGPYKHVLRYSIDIMEDIYALRYGCDPYEEEEEGGEENVIKEVFLELWRISRRSQLLIAMVGQLYSVKIGWGSQAIQLHVLVMVDGVMAQTGVPACIECGQNNTVAYTCSRFDWEIYNAYSRQEEVSIPASIRFLYMLILDADAFDFCCPDMFRCWPYQMVKDEMDRHRPGQHYARFTIERAGLVEDESSTPFRKNEDWSGSTSDEDGCLERRRSQGQSPILQFMSTMELVEQYEAEDKEEEDRIARIREAAETDKEVRSGLQSPENLRGPVAKRESTRAQKKKNKLGRKKREKVILTTAQFKAILGLCIEGVDPSCTEAQIDAEIEKLDVEKLTEEMNEKMKGMSDDDDVGEILRKTVQEMGVKEENEEDVEMSPWTPARVKPEPLDDSYPTLNEIAEVFEDSEEEEDLDDLDDPAEIERSLAFTASEEELPGLESSGSWGKPENWDTTWHSQSSDGSFLNSSSRASSKGHSPGSGQDGDEKSPPAKKARGSMLGEETPESDKIHFSPFLTKKVTEEMIRTVSTGSSDGSHQKPKVVRRMFFVDDVVDIPTNVREEKNGAEEVVEIVANEDGEVIDGVFNEEGASGDTGGADQ